MKKLFLLFLLAPGIYYSAWSQVNNSTGNNTSSPTGAVQVSPLDSPSLTPVAAWDFFGVPSSPAPVFYPAAVFNSNLISSGNITRGPGAPGSSATNAFRTTGFQNNGISTANTDYFEVTLGAATGYTLSLSTIDARFGGTGTYYATPGVTSQFAYSLDGSTFNLIGSPVTSTALTMAQIDLAAITALQNVAYGTTVTLRYYASGQTTTGGWGFASTTAGSYGLAIGGTLNPAGGPATAIYTWNQSGTASWTNATNWTPNRTAPQAGDILMFTNGATCNITDVPTQTISQLILTNSTVINLQSAAPVILTIGGGNGADLDVPAGCTLQLGGGNAITVSLGTGATGNILGHVSSSPSTGAANKLIATDPGSVTFQFGSSYTAGAFTTGHPFGTTSPESIIFNNGSTFIQQAGDDPFGATQPNSVVVFQSGSLCKVNGVVPVSVAGRNYANLEVDAPGATISAAGESPFTIENLSVTNGTFNLNLTGTPGHSIKGNIYVANGANLNFAPASAGTIMLNGSCSQAISGSGGLTNFINSTLEIANSNGVEMNKQVILNGNLKLTVGLLTIGPNDLLLTSSSSITGTPCASAMIVATGDGQVKKEFSGPGSFTYPVGDHTGVADYSPVTLEISAGTFAAGNYAGVSLVNAKYPDDPNTDNYLNRYWKTSVNGVSSYSCNATFHYVPEDVTGNESQIYCVRVDQLPFIAYNAANPALHTLNTGSLATLGTFTGSAAAPALFEVAGSGSYCQGLPGLTVTLSGSQLNVSYQLRKNGVDHGAPVAGTGESITWPGQLAGIYTVIATNSCGSILMNGSAIIEEIPSVLPALAIAPSANPVCPNTPVAFTAIPGNGGSNPTYQWKVNGVNAGSNSPVYSYTVLTNDVVTCELTSSLSCIQQNPVTSNTVNMMVNEILPVGISIASSANPVCVGTSVTFTATPVNGGTSPTYQWKVNDVNVGTNDPAYTYVPENGDKIVCNLTSNLQCVICNPAISNMIIMTVNATVSMNANVSGTVESGRDTSYNATELITVAGGTSSFLVQDQGWATMFAGDNIHLLPGTRVEHGGFMHGLITSTGLNCGMLEPSIIAVAGFEPGNTIEKSSFTVYPNPTTGFVTLKQKGDKAYGALRMELFGLHGEKLRIPEMKHGRKHRFSLADAPPGLYFLRVFTGESVETIKISKH